MTGRDNSPIYDDLMRFKPEGMTPNAWARKAGVSRTVWSDMRRHGNPSRRTLEKLLTAAGSSLAEFEALRIGRAPAVRGKPAAAVADRGSGWGAQQLPSLPLLATRPGGEWGASGSGIEMTGLRTGELAGSVARPASLSADETAYAIAIVGDSMWPRFRAGRRVAVSAKAPIAVGDDVLVKLKSGAEHKRAGDGTVAVLIKELVGKTAAGLELRQFNPDVTFQLPASEIAAVEKVVGELI